MAQIARSLIIALLPPLLIVVGYQVLVRADICRPSHEQCVWAVGLSYFAVSFVLGCISFVGLILIVRDCLNYAEKRKRPQ
jgi:hypothetical protein